LAICRLFGPWAPDGELGSAGPSAAVEDEEGRRLQSYRLAILFLSALLALTIVGFVNARGSSRATATRRSESCGGLVAAARTESGYTRETLRLSSSISQLLGEVAVAAWTQDAHRLNAVSADIAAKQRHLRAISARVAALEPRLNGSAATCTRRP
jgi:hypothetical protein